MSAPPAAVVECDSLTKVFQDFWGRGKVLAVDALNLRIVPGEVFGLLGPNGSGKTTTIKMLLGLLYPTRGRARIFDRLPTDTAVKARIGYMPEESYLYRFLDARETLDYYGRLFRLDRAERSRRADQLIEMVGLRRAARRPVGQYSKGMARRIGLAQALINDPDLLILDEPTTGLDPIGARQIKDVIVELAKRGKTVILCSHLLADVEDVCDRAAIMYGGKLQAIGTIRELLARQDITQITLRQPPAEKLGEIRQFIEQRTGTPVVSIDHPTDRLEDLFLRVVEQAQRQQIATSGAESRRGVSEFLAAPEGAERRTPGAFLDALVAAGAAPPPTDEPAAAASPRPAPRFEVLENLTDDAKSFVADEPAEPGEPRALPGKRVEPNRSLLDRLTRPDDPAAP